MKKKMIIFGIILCFILIYLCFVCLPYKEQGAVTAEITESFVLSDFYGGQECEERAMILSDNEHALEERIRLIAGATERIVLCTFDFRADNSGKMILSALYDAAKRGVEVQILVDGFPYLSGMMGDDYFRAVGCLDNVTIKVYNPLHLLKPTKAMSRLHDKYLIVDDTGYILGGRNTYDYFLGNDTDYKNHDWDILVFTGESSGKTSLDKLEAYFQSVWNMEECKVVMEQKPKFTFSKEKLQECEKALNEIYHRTRAEQKDWFETADIEAKTVEVSKITLLSNPVETSVKEPTLFYMMTELMIEAEGDVTFHTPYILCNDYMMERLEKVCSSEKNVRMMTNSVANNGNMFGAVDYEMNKAEVLDTGLEILEYDKGVSYHGKCFTIGDRLTAVGSFNWDMRSSYIDTELMLVIDSPELNQMMRAYMGQYETDALLVTDKSAYELKEGQIPQDVGGKKKGKITLLKPFDKIFRFLF